MNVLIVEDSQNDTDLLILELQRGGFNPNYERVETVEAMEKALQEKSWDIILSDYSMPDFSAPAALETLQKSGLDIPFIVISGTVGEEIAVECLKAGAHDFLVKGQLIRLLPAIKRELQEAQVRKARKEAEDALRKSERQLSDFFENATVGLHWVGPDGTILRANRAELEMLGYSEEEYIGHHIAEFHADELVISDILGRLSGNEILKNYPARLRCKDGSIKEVLISSNVYWENGEFIHTRCFTRDISELKEAQRELQLYTKKLEQSNKELEHFATIASHDLQAPLRKIQAFSDMLKQSDGDTLSKEGKDYLERLCKSTQRMSHLITDLLDLSRVTRRGKPFQKVDISQVLSGVLDELHEYKRAVNGHVEAGELCTVDADPDQIYLVLKNLIENGLKFHQEGIPPIVKISSSVEKNAGREYCQITVEDNGIGFKDEYKDKIFEIFQRLHGTDAYSGTGMGLALVKKITERHEGSIEVTSTPGEGSTFIIRLPVRQCSI